MTTYEITSRSGETMGLYEGETPAHALVAMHTDAGYAGRVRVEGGAVVFDSEETEAVAGGLDAWALRAVEIAACAYCGREVEQGAVPAADDDAAWARLAEAHDADCEWIATRAHRQDA